MRIIAGFFAAGLLLSGVVVGLLPITTPSGDCGSAFFRSSYGTSDDAGRAACIQARQSARQLPIALFITGAMLTAGILKESRPGVAPADVSDPES